MTNLITNAKKVLKHFVEKSVVKALELKHIDIAGLTIDSRSVEQGFLFMAYPGEETDGRKFIKSAIENGAILVLAEVKSLEGFAKEFEVLLDDNQQVIAYEYKAIKIVPVPNLRDKVSQIAGKYYGSPTKKMSLVGVTGTNGKTSICYLAAQAFEFMQKPTLLLSTLGNGQIDNLEVTTNTTSDPVTLQAKAAEYLNKACHHLCMEVSSHGLDQARVSGLNYSIAVFSNLSHDHLEYHGDMESYFLAKRKLFIRDEIQTVVINADDLYGQRLLLDEEIIAKKVAYTRNKDLLDKQLVRKIEGWIESSNEEFTLNGINADLMTPWGTGRINSRLLGDFNLSNLLAVAGILGSIEGDLNKFLVALNAAKPVKGRMQQFSCKNAATFVVDYAHTPDALEKALQTLNHHCQGDLWCIFGCGGDRDSSKRSMMGMVAEKNAQQIIITDDNPRTEAPELIVEMIRDGFSDQTIPYIASRKAAIENAYASSTAMDMVLVAGKGHEDYQEIGSVKHHYSDIDTVANILEAHS
ncbi:UDP-N-acetylmuramoyl-L-alanyl-D-glutamate--2,6-diaminopimelate ligase [Kangiella sp. HZ709]|uniref:UDP-N-acetylmuramoyl-L-alanyl-D-glutamate--2, 6-diaminopimelate ligase n=1 Tax=Kangiella sp. HZ709 TaxID=2666328 RepID=UPI0012B0F83C|nr:UDP-N-acetylmuramoyl-L-alanyl-D-glutamate--2,6-diaminopimelate ligase [Kangiella sp. HZ709]MRX27427.1 UDP-N-acetylmuramoyl-L-alanyl-D-glutamate--2,6-diaminopimelate ligase [Kangiella sp. HZ709]